MKVLKLMFFEPAERPPRGQAAISTRDGDAVHSVVASDKQKIYPLPGGQFLVDWGDPTIRDGAMTLVGAADVKFAHVVLTDAEREKLLK